MARRGELRISVPIGYSWDKEPLYAGVYAYGKSEKRARSSRGIETKHGADLSSAQGRYQAIEALSFDGTARRSTEIIINDLDAREATSTCHLN